ncbi:hypothetical protein CEUSTIGMA_g1780.t1 [Chlamydomonas eustigma]|uniref:Uncharacterized protein n=1 Tax=Chlamydomonas eustigma TaxID=1157962 RepID=A0A250WU38_9CHLO|nr:hypothetical protein CEUSTIGMA_g1780.t1 [Chlamydomonas eustigma]|eukprot:GAX74331.1 hypothetical protein CEUSTIGMA_g1780.t1 [Chlamydomonas eustigma]
MTCVHTAAMKAAAYHYDMRPYSCNEGSSVSATKRTLVSQLPRHPLLSLVIQLILERFRAGMDVSSRNPHFVHQHTGPGVWSAAVTHYLGFDKGLVGKAGEVFRKVHSDRGTFLRVRNELGVCLVGRPFFGGLNVKNHYGSLNFKNGWASWTEERSQLILRQAVSPQKSSLLVNISKQGIP